MRNERTITAEKPEAPAWPASPLGIRVAISEACSCVMMCGDYTRAAGICPRTTALAAFAIAYNAMHSHAARQATAMPMENASCVYVLFGDGGICA